MIQNAKLLGSQITSFRNLLSGHTHT